MPQDEIDAKTEAEAETGAGEQLSATAARWVARCDRGPLSLEETRALEQWLATSITHRGAFARAQAALAYFDDALVEAINTSLSEGDARGAPAQNIRLASSPSAYAASAAHVTRRRLLWIGGGFAGAAAASIAAFTVTQKPPAITYSAKRGEIRVVSLVDGSLITLDTASIVAVQYLRDVRNVELLAGRALFDVAKDKQRPFVVTAASLKIQAVGTSFVVRKPESHPAEVLVQEGIVDVAQQMANAPVRVGANMRVVASVNASPALNVMSVDPAAVSRELAWRQGMLAFEDVSLATVAEEFARYSDARIVISDPKLATTTITGLFAADNPLGFARAAALSLGLALEVEGQKITLRRL